jgi:hypothetical protein
LAAVFSCPDDEKKTLSENDEIITTYNFATGT